jgi:hypothetical protein
MAVVFFVSWPARKWIKFRPVSASLYETTKAAVDKNPRLQPAWDIALQDRVLTWPEANDWSFPACAKPFSASGRPL